MLLTVLDFADWKMVSGWKKSKMWVMDVEAATSQCNTDISYCETVDWHLEPQVIVGR